MDTFREMRLLSFAEVARDRSRRRRPRRCCSTTVWANVGVTRIGIVAVLASPITDLCGNSLCLSRCMALGMVTDVAAGEVELATLMAYPIARLCLAACLPRAGAHSAPSSCSLIYMSRYARFAEMLASPRIITRHRKRILGSRWQRCSMGASRSRHPQRWCSIAPTD